MSTPFAHLHPDVRAMIALDDAKRIEALQHERWIDYPRATEALQRLERLPWRTGALQKVGHVLGGKL